MQYVLGFVYNPAPNVKKSVSLYLFISFCHRVFIYWHWRQTAGYWLCAFLRGFVWKGDPSPLQSPPTWGPPLDKPSSPGWALLGAQKLSPSLSLDLSTDWELCTKKQSLIQQRNLNLNMAKSNIHCETSFNRELEKLPFPWKALCYDSCGVFVRFRGRGKWGAKPEEKTCQPLIHFFHWYMYGRLNRDLNNSKCLDCQSSIISLRAQGSSTIECTVPYRKTDCSAHIHN